MACQIHQRSFWTSYCWRIWPKPRKPESNLVMFYIQVLQYLFNPGVFQVTDHLERWRFSLRYPQNPPGGQETGGYRIPSNWTTNPAWFNCLVTNLSCTFWELGPCGGGLRAVSCLYLVAFCESLIAAAKRGIGAELWRCGMSHSCRAYVESCKAWHFWRALKIWNLSQSVDGVWTE